MIVLAADVGGGTVRAARVDASGRVLGRASAPTPADPAEGFALLDRLWESLGPGDARALAVAGGIRPATGEITMSPNMKRWEGTRPAEVLHCRVLNDANAAALGEAWLGALRGRRSAVLVTLGTGVGGGVLLEGRLWEGATGCAGEVGHMTIRFDGPPCGCGARGCLETFASATAVARAAGAADALLAARAARSGDARAKEAFRAAGEALGVAFGNLANLLNPEAFCVAGGMAAALDLMTPALAEAFARQAFPLAREGVVVVPGALGDDAGLLGAAASVVSGAAPHVRLP